MNRLEAIRHIRKLTELVAWELERRSPSEGLGQQTRAALHALGVTDAEILESEDT